MPSWVNYTLSGLSQKIVLNDAATMEKNIWKPFHLSYNGYWFFIAVIRCCFFQRLCISWWSFWFIYPFQNMRPSSRTHSDYSVEKWKEKEESHLFVTECSKFSYIIHTKKRPPEFKILKRICVQKNSSK